MSGPADQNLVCILEVEICSIKSGPKFNLKFISLSLLKRSSIQEGFPPEIK